MELFRLHIFRLAVSVSLSQPRGGDRLQSNNDKYFLQFMLMGQYNHFCLILVYCGRNGWDWKGTETGTADSPNEFAYNYNQREEWEIFLILIRLRFIQPTPPPWSPQPSEAVDDQIVRMRRAGLRKPQSQQVSIEDWMDLHNYSSSSSGRLLHQPTQQLDDLLCCGVTHFGLCRLESVCSSGHF